MVDPYRIETECVECGKKYELEVENPPDFVVDVLAGFADAIIQYTKLRPHKAASYVEERMEKHHNLVSKEDGLYCKSCA